MNRLTTSLQTSLGLAAAALLAGPSLAQSTDNSRTNRMDSNADNRSAYERQENRFYSDSDANAYGPTKGDFEVLINGTGSNDTDFDSGAGAFEVSLGYYVIDEVIVGLRQGVGLAGASTGDDLDDSDWDVTGLTDIFADYVFDLGRFRPFVGASIGYFYGEGVDDSFIAGPEAGLKFYVLEDTFIIARGAYQWTFEDSDDADSNFDDGRWNYTLGVGFNF